MPFKNREQQLRYMRIYMQRKRALDRIERLKQHKQRLLKRYEEEPALKYFISREELGSAIPGQIEKCMEVVRECEGLLKGGQNCQIWRGHRKP